MTVTDTARTDEPPTWAELFERAPPAISETTVREVISAHRTEA